MDILLAFIITFAFFTILMSVRNDLIFKIRSREIDCCYERAKARIENDNLFTSIAETQNEYRVLVKPSYDAMMLDLTKWTHRQFYPGSYK